MIKFIINVTHFSGGESSLGYGWLYLESQNTKAGETLEAIQLF